MNLKFTILLALLCSAITLSAGSKRDYKLKKENVSVDRIGDNLMLSMDLILDSTRLRSNHQLFITPIIQTADKKHTSILPTVLFSGRNMHYLYQRNPKKATPSADYNVATEVWHKSGTTSKIRYAHSVPLKDWMSGKDAMLRLMVDTCGCGISNAGADTIPFCLNKAPQMLLMAYPVPLVEDDKIIVHQGKAKVQFEVDKFQLHDEVYTYTHKVTKRRHVIDNRKELQTIDDSLHYALNSPNVELVSLDIRGYASPESPYDHNEYLALNRAKAVMIYLEKHDNIPDSVCSYHATPENWQMFREQVLAAKDITEQQRKDLIELIDRPIHSNGDYDRKETELGTSPKFAALYKNHIHPDWFPELRYTEFTIRTRLKHMTIEQLRQVMIDEPKRLSLSQFYRVALSYGHGTEGFHKAMTLALENYPKDPMSNTNAAALAVEEQRYEDAKKFLEHAGDSDDANILRGIVATNDGDLEAARQFFQKAIKQPEAQRNLNLIK